jgi:hypothetical protein
MKRTEWALRRKAGILGIGGAGRVGTGMPVKVLVDLRRRLDPLARKSSPLTATVGMACGAGLPILAIAVAFERSTA